MECVTQDQVLAFLAGSLPAEPRRAIEQHLDACAECLELITLAGQTSLAAPAAAGDVGPDDDYGALVRVDPEHYVIGRELARGGVGRIIAARDRRHGRQVAIKQLLEGSGELRARFEREARITARLQHPAIVNLLEAGTWPDGEPFYVMKLVTGESLDRAIASRTSLAARLALLPHVIAAVDALSYAHSVRVIHRDLKPANVLVGEFGETVVIDWGFAKDLADANAPEVTVGPYRTASAPGQTLAGSVIGTPAYMPIEQAQGGAVDERADVYALGAMLYHVLAGAPPFTGKTSEAILAAVIAGPPPPLAARAPDAPAELVTIVGKAMAHDAADRYPTAKQLADDLKKFQTGQLVGAHRYTTWQLVRRWIRRHRAPVAVAAAAAVLLGALGVVSLRRIVDEQARTDAQRRAADTARVQAEDLMSFMLGDLRDKLQPIGRLDLLDDVATKAVAYYDQRGTAVSDTELAQIAMARRNVGDVLIAQGHTDQALAAYRASLAIAEILAAKDPTSVEGQTRLATAHVKVGNVVFTQNDTPAALAEFRASLALREAVTAKVPDDADRQRDLSVGHQYVGDVLFRMGKVPDALVEYRAFQALAITLAAKDPANLDWQRDLAVSHDKLAAILVAQGDVAAALDKRRAALALFDAIAAKDPTNVNRQRDLFISHSKLGALVTAQGDTTAALAEYRASLAIATSLAARDPTNSDRQRDLAIGHTMVGNTLLARGKTTDALVEYREAAATFAALAASDPGGTDRLRDVAVSHQKVGDVLRELPDFVGALAEYRDELAAWTTLAARDPASGDLQLGVSTGHDDVGDLLVELGKPAEALVEFRASLAIRTALAATDPANTEWQRAVSVAHDNVGDALLASRDAAGALVEFRASLALREALATTDPTNAEWQGDVAEGEQKLGDALAAQGDRAGASAAYATGLGIARELAARDPDNAQVGALVTRLAARVAGKAPGR